MLRSARSGFSWIVKRCGAPSSLCVTVFQRLQMLRVGDFARTFGHTPSFRLLFLRHSGCHIETSLCSMQLTTDRFGYFSRAHQAPPARLCSFGSSSKRECGAFTSARGRRSRLTGEFPRFWTALHRNRLFNVPLGVGRQVWVLQLVAERGGGSSQTGQ